MNSGPRLTFKLASTPEEFEWIHRLNYRTFVEEIPQYPPNPDRRLVDKFHADNTYAICLSEGKLVGMIAGRSQRPFSLDAKLPDLDSHLPRDRRVCEMRLLSVEKEFRIGSVFWGLVELIATHFRAQGYDLAIISGTVRQLRLYDHLGFIPFGPRVGTAEALYQPMYLTLEAFTQTTQTLKQTPGPPADQILANLLPGPVEVHPDVQAAFFQPPVSHRAPPFAVCLRETKKQLCALTQGDRVEILVGSGSLANDTVAGQISLLKAPGLILSNGEFGVRLVDQATRFGLDFKRLDREWGEPFEAEDLRVFIEQNPAARWLWAVHCETSTSVLNDVSLLKELCGPREIKLCLDCVSSIGTVPVDLRGVYLASGVSGKGLAAYPGLSMVFYDHPLAPAPQSLPRYLDLGFYAAQDGVPFTHSSNLLAALRAALERVCWTDKFTRLRNLSGWLRSQLDQLGFQTVAARAHTSPAVVTIALPPHLNSKVVGWRLQRAGYLLSYRSEYLLQRNWIQICLMGEYSKDRLEGLIAVMARIQPLPEAPTQRGLRHVSGPAGASPPSRRLGSR